MLNIHDLESQWLRYKIKSYFPHALVTLAATCILILFLFIDTNYFNKPIQKDTLNIQKEKNVLNISTKDKNMTEEIISPPIIKKSIEVSILKQEVPQENKALIDPNKLLIEPSLDFLRNMKEDSPEYYTDYSEVIDTIVETTVKKANAIEKPIQKITPIKVQELTQNIQVEEKPAAEIKIQRQNTKKDIQHVIKRFKSSNNPALSLFIAKKYYDLKNYNQSYNYSLITNELNNDIEESWIVFAKSLYKLDKKAKAVEVLKKYISSSHSHRAKILLDNIKAGKIL